MRALLLEQQDDQTLAHIKDIGSDRLPEGDVTVDINWSSLNYKDALAITGKGKIVRNFPMVPGIDFAGTVAQSSHPAWRAGDAVLLNAAGALLVAGRAADLREGATMAAAAASSARVCAATDSPGAPTWPARWPATSGSPRGTADTSPPTATTSARTR